MAAEYTVDFIWDEDASVWIATSEDIPGLVLESGSLDALIERVRFAVPELLALNGVSLPSIPMFFRSSRHELVAV
ncbi:MAG: DUF1902 domain-containing protein [Acidobacteriota bacterium]|jgi:hypothetical protein|nr:DUF1902 domain-containing protein [Acidobacteriota bacterium]